MNKRTLSGWIAILCGLSPATATAGRQWNDEVIYFVLTDRFHDGDPANNQPQGSDPALYDPRQRDISRYHGGDFRGLELAIESGYFNALGVTALWLTPPVRNVWYSGPGRGSAGYHGYWAQDFLDIDPHLTSARSLEGEPYHDNREGRMAHWRDLVSRAQKHGLRVIQDVVLNHAGPVFYCDMDGDGVFDADRREEWMAPYLEKGFHDNALWLDRPEWNAGRTGPIGPTRILGRRIPTKGVLAELETYGRKGWSPGVLGRDDGAEQRCDFFSLRGFRTDPDSGHFDRLIDEFAAIYHFHLSGIGVDGLRVDTVKHMHPRFLDAFTARLRQRLGPAAREKILFGETYDYDPQVVGRSTWRGDGGVALDSMLSFPLCGAIRAYLRHPGDRFGHAGAIEDAMAAFTRMDADGRPLFNANPGADGLNSIQKSVTFVGNHDGLNRFRVQEVTAEHHRLAQALALTLPGIPCLYYGAEIDLQDTSSRIADDSENGRMTLWPRDAAPTLAGLRQSPGFAAIARITGLRSEIPALRRGDFVPLWVDGDAADDDGIFAFARTTGRIADNAVLVLNAGPRAARTGWLDLSEILGAGRWTAIGLLGEPAGEDAIEISPAGLARLGVGAGSAVLFQRARE